MPQTPTSPPTEASVPGKSGPQATEEQGPEGPTGGVLPSPLTLRLRGALLASARRESAPNPAGEGEPPRSAESGCDQVPHVAPVHGTGDHPATEAHVSDSEFHFGRMISCYTLEINFS